MTEEEIAALQEKANRVDALEASKKRVEEEASKIKARAKEAEDKLKEAEVKELEAKGKTQELLDKERADRIALEEKLKARTTSALKEKLRTEVLKVAKDAHDVDMILKVSEHKQLLKLDEDSLGVEGVKEFVEAVRGSHSFLFGAKRMDTTNNLPPGKKAEEEFKSEEEKYLSELRGCETKKELNAIKKKYGKTIEY